MQIETQQSITRLLHGPMSEVIYNLIRAGIHITKFEEYNYSPYNCFKHTIQVDKDKYRIRHLNNKLPMTYAITGVKP